MIWRWISCSNAARRTSSGHRVRGTVRRWVIVLAFLSLGPLLLAHTIITTKITWSREVSRIVYKHCASCHRDGGSAFSLMTYEQSRPWAEAIKEEVLARRMPPWNAVKGFGEFKNDRGLTQEEIDIIANWAVGGAPEGNPLYMPPKPEFLAPEGESRDRGQLLAFSGSMMLEHPMEVLGIEPTRVPASGVLQAIARRPDGEIEPLIWVQKFNPRYNGTYYFRNTLRFPAGTKIEIRPLAGGVALVLKTSRHR